MLNVKETNIGIPWDIRTYYEQWVEEETFGCFSSPRPLQRDWVSTAPSRALESRWMCWGRDSTREW